MAKLSEKCNIQVPMEVLKWVLFLFLFLLNECSWEVTFACFLMFVTGVLFLHFFAFSLIDNGKNPDEFTRDVLNSCIARNQVTKGKTDAFKVKNVFC